MAGAAQAAVLAEATMAEIESVDSTNSLYRRVLYVTGIQRQAITADIAAVFDQGTFVSYVPKTDLAGYLTISTTEAAAALVATGTFLFENSICSVDYRNEYNLEVGPVPTSCHRDTADVLFKKLFTNCHHILEKWVNSSKYVQLIYFRKTAMEADFKFLQDKCLTLDRINVLLPKMLPASRFSSKRFENMSGDEKNQNAMFAIREIPENSFERNIAVSIINIMKTRDLHLASIKNTCVLDIARIHSNKSQEKEKFEEMERKRKRDDAQQEYEEYQARQRTHQQNTANRVSSYMRNALNNGSEIDIALFQFNE